MRHLHVAIVVSAFIVPLPSALINFKDGFLGAEYPVPLCVGRNSDITYYFLTLPQSVFIGLSSAVLALVLWLIFKVKNNFHF